MGMNYSCMKDKDDNVRQQTSLIGAKKNVIMNLLISMVERKGA